MRNQTHVYCGMWSIKEVFHGKKNNKSNTGIKFEEMVL